VRVGERAGSPIRLNNGGDQGNSVTTITEVRTPPPAEPKRAATADERLAFRGPIQRVLVRPEIGALVGTTAVWVFFWAVGGAFGTAAGTASYLDVAAGLGIMAVAVSLLMIGGEFDLSAGAMTGATGMLVILFSQEVGELGGAGLTLHLAVPLSLAFALMIGWFNGTVVEKTRLPSFIVTLGTFFVLIGAKLGFSKLLSGQVVVEGLNEAEGYDFWRKVFAASWVRNNHIWADRDVVWTILAIAGVALIAAGVLEMSYRRAGARNAKGLIGFVAGAAVAFAGFYGLLNSDGVPKNVVNGAILAIGVLGAVLSWAWWRYRPIGRRGPIKLERRERSYVALGVVLVGAAVLLAALFNPDSQNSVGTLLSDGFARGLFVTGIGVAGVLAVLVAAGKVPVAAPLIGVAISAIPAVGFLMTRQGARAVLFVGLAVVGLLALIVASSRAAVYSASAGLAVELLTAVVVVGLAFYVRADSTSAKFRTELFTVMLLIALALACSALLGYLFAARTAPDPEADTLGKRAAITGILLLVAATAVMMLYMTPAEAEATDAVTRYRISIFWFIAFAVFATWLLVRARFGNWIFAVGGNKEAARVEGVPAARTKTTLFMLVSAAAWLVGMLIAFRLNSVQANVGDGEEFEFIIAAVVGGNLLTGGYGSAAGGAIGSLIMAMSTQGIPFAGWNTNWRFLFLGVILLLAVAGNNYVRRRAETASRPTPLGATDE
jgi:ribose/xylose/arabinose/galactoside ABC-type transport system permease subunit